MDIDQSRPIWLQLVDEFQRRVVAGTWQQGAKTPSVRELATELGVNPNTVQRALSETDRMGLTVPMRTSGRFVTEDETVIHTARATVAQETIDRFVVALAGIGMDRDEAISMLRSRWEAPTRGEDE